MNTHEATVYETREQLESALDAPDDEKNYHIRQALQVLGDVDEPVAGATDSEAPSRPPSGVHWTSQDWGVLRIPVTRPFVEWMELEANERGSDDVAEWARTQLMVTLGRNLQKQHGFTANVEVDVPEEFARRARLYHDDLELHDADPCLEEIIYNHMTLDATFCLDGEPIANADDEIDRGQDDE